jgi:putative peptidoglycan lipid II flippase
MRATLQRGLRMVLFLTVPSTVGLALLGVPIIRLIYEHGKFSPHATLETARALSGYAVGLVAYASIKVVAPAFYALGRTRVPLIASVSAVAANLVWNIATFRRFGHVGLALGTSIAALVNAAVLVFAFEKLIHGFVSRELLLPFAKILAAAGVMAVAVWAASSRLELLPGGGTIDAAIKAFVPIIIGVGVYFIAARALRLEEAKTLLKRFR